jgi:hypothetical protein
MNYYCITRVQTVSLGGYIVDQKTTRIGPFESREAAAEWQSQHPDFFEPRTPGTHIRVKIDSLLDGVVHPDDY